MATKLHPNFRKNASLPLKGQWRVHDAWNSTPHLAHALPRLAQNANLTHALMQLMPDTLKTGWKAYLSEDTLTLKVPHNGIAMRIKQMLPLLQDGLQMTGWRVNHMVVKVSHFNQPVWLKSEKETEKAIKPINKRILTPLSASCIADTIGHLPEDSTLRRALLELLKAHR